MSNLSFAQKINATIGKTNITSNVGNHNISNIAPTNTDLYTLIKRPVIQVTDAINEIIKISLLFFEMIKNEKGLIMSLQLLKSSGLVVNEQVLQMVGNFIFVRPELLPGFLIKLNIKN